jgi:16S rRNA G966 N2-methylase RsmD
MRIIAGKCPSRILKSLKSLALRPTNDHRRETLFHCHRVSEPLVQRKTIQIICKRERS